MEESLSWIIVLGCQRSGTTMTGQILGAHSKCFLIDEQPDGLYSLFEKIESAEFETNLRNVVSIARRKYLKSRGSFSEIRNYRLVAKAPNLTYRHHDLAKLYPRPKIIYPVRDVRSVVASILAIAPHRPIIQRQIEFILDSEPLNLKYAADISLLQNRATPEHVKAAIIWKIKTNAYVNFEDIGLQPLCFKYEELINDSVSYAHKLATHCGLDFENEMLNHHKILRGMGAGLTSRTRGIDGSSLEKWENQLSGSQIAEVMEIAEASMRELGYLS